jgi:hypothetical protein
VAYDRPAAWAKFAMLAAAVVVYYAVAWQPQKNLWHLAEGWAVLGAGLAGYFLLTYDWQQWPADFGGLTRLGRWWMGVRPAVPGFLQANVAGGLLALCVPFAVAAVWRAGRERQAARLALNAGLLALTGLGLLFTSSRGAWAALGAAAGLWVVWEGVDRLAARWRWPSRAVFGGLVALAGAGMAAGLLAYPGGIVALVNRLPGAQDGFSRYEMAQGAWRLVGDFPFTGGGLGAFSGLYSTYILGISVPQFTYSHNFFLDVALEQGVVGCLAVAGILAGSAGLMVGGQPAAREAAAAQDYGWRCAVLVSLGVVGLHGLLDDALYGNGGTPLLFAVAGMAAALAHRRAAGAPATRPSGSNGRRLAVGLMAGGLLVALVLASRTLLAAGYTNLGAVQMAQRQLAGWPAHPDLPASAFAGPEALFRQAVALDPANRTGRQRLGLIDLARGDFSAAVAELETAYRVDPGHRGVRKALGYSYVWLGQPEQAVPLLTGLPEAVGELETYAWWWGTQGRPDLADRAAWMAKRLVQGS